MFDKSSIFKGAAFGAALVFGPAAAAQEPPAAPAPSDSLTSLLDSVRTVPRLAAPVAAVADSTDLERDRKSVVSGKSVDLGGRRIIKKK